MEIAEQWQREWSGTAEYGKVTEGGVTRNVARAMEVLHASKPGAHVRVMRAAYHSSAGPGIPTSSYMLHSSRRIISSGFNYTEPPSLQLLPSKPLEISSIPLDSTPDLNAEAATYKVTEPDDLEISEPTKWRGSNSKSTIRMPSEESSSTENASVIDVDHRTNKYLNRKYSYDSDSSDNQWNKSKTGFAPMIDAPVALNTLKYTSLLNSTNDWHNRRKSYSFEETVPSKESMLYGNDTKAIESSTDSGICKSSEIVNDGIDKTNELYPQENKHELNGTTFTAWLSKNRKNSFYNSTQFKSYKEHDIVIEEPNLNHITLQSSGKMSISLPLKVETDCSYQINKKESKDQERQRRIKKVEFCKTELHFAAETGQVNIIASDEKPPPSNDFRKRRSVFLPLHDIPDKPVTLFGDKVNEISEHTYNEISESDENTAATKSILKNKIPKPKPYLLGENMEFGSPSHLVNSKDHLNVEIPTLTAVSLINKQLHLQRRYSNDEITSILPKDTDSFIHKNNDFRANAKGPNQNISLSTAKSVFAASQQSVKSNNVLDNTNTKTNRFRCFERSPIERRSKTRALRDTDLTYFGVHADGYEKSENVNVNEYTISSDDSTVDNIFQSVKLIQKIANSVCSSEPELDDTPEYQNVPICNENAPVPMPRIRIKYDEKPVVTKKDCNLKPIVVQDCYKIVKNDEPVARRPRLRKQDVITVASNRSISEPPNRNRSNSRDTTYETQNQSPRCTKYNKKEENVNIKLENKNNNTNVYKKSMPAVTTPIYINLNNKNKTAQREDLSPHHQERNEKSKVADKRDLKYINNNLQLDKLNKGKNRLNFSETNSLKKNRQSWEKVEKTNKTNDNKKNNNEYVCSSQSANKSIYNTLKAETNINHGKKLQHESETFHHHPIHTRSNNTVSSITKDKTEKKIKITNSNNIEGSEYLSKGNAYSKKEASFLNPERHKKISEHDLNSTQIKLNNTKNKDYSSKLSSRKPASKSKYVINYDDKKGTVASVCKIKLGLAGTSRKKSVTKEFINDNATEKTLSNALNKRDLLQCKDQPRQDNGFRYADKKWKTVIHEHKSCQLL